MFRDDCVREHSPERTETEQKLYQVISSPYPSLLFFCSLLSQQLPEPLSGSAWPCRFTCAIYRREIEEYERTQIFPTFEAYYTFILMHLSVIRGHNRDEPTMLSRQPGSSTIIDITDPVTGRKPTVNHRGTLTVLLITTSLVTVKKARQHLPPPPTPCPCT